MIRILSTLTFAGLFAAIVSCSGIPDLNAKKDDSGSSESGEVKDLAGDCTAEDCDTKGDGQSFAKLGLANHCTFSKAEAKGCFVCTPRELPKKMCTDVDADFDPAKSCEYDLDLMTCKVRADGDAFEFDFSEQTQIEKIYSKIPFLILGAKVLIGGKLKDQPIVKELIFTSFDAVLKHKKAIFTQGDMGGFIDDIAAAVRKAKPDIDNAKVEGVKNAIKTASKGLAESYGDGKIDDKDFLNFAHGILSAMPKELLGNVLEELDIGKILAALQASGNQDIINEIINSSGGSAEEVMAGIEG